MRLVTLSFLLTGRKVVIDADKILSITDATHPEPALGKISTIHTEIRFQGDYAIEPNVLTVNQSVDEVVNRIRSAIALDERI